VEYFLDIWKKLAAIFDWKSSSQVITNTFITLVSYSYYVFHSFRMTQRYNSTECLNTHI
jgi:hypothetical protein